jgi:hypothetical protein
MKQFEEEDKRNEAVRKLIISGIKEGGFPVGFLRGEADGDYGIIAKSEHEIVLLGYAEEFWDSKIPPKSLEELNGIDLIYLLYGTKDEKELKEFEDIWNETKKRFD